MQQKANGEARPKRRGKSKKPPAKPAQAPQISWPADRVERRPVAELRRYDRNPRKHTDEEIDLVAASIKRYGWTVPVLIDENATLIAGHCRLAAAEKLGLESVPVMVAEGWSDEEKRAYCVLDNQLTIKGEWDGDLLRGELGELQGVGFDLSTLGFSDKELDELLGGATEEPVDGIEDAPASKYEEQYGVIVICKDELEQTEVYDRLTADGLNCKVVAT